MSNMQNLRRKINLALYETMYCTFCVCIFKGALSTEITEISYFTDHSLNFTIHLPVLRCHAKDLTYDEVSWYKDGIMVKRGGTSSADHILSVNSLLDRTSFEFQHPLKLQGYYWCETDSLAYTTYHKHLFRIKQIHTYVGKLLATRDSIAEDEILSMYGDIFRKKKTYEKGMTEILFNFLPKPNTFVIQVQDSKDGLSVEFYLYARQMYIRARPLESEIEDHHELEYITTCLIDGTCVDNHTFNVMQDWAEMKGIQMKDIELTSTFACYEENVVTEQSTVMFKWPYAKIGEIVLPEIVNSSIRGLSMTRTCIGDFTSGAEWWIPYGEYNNRDSKLTSELKKLLKAFGKAKTHRYVQRLEDFSRKALEVIDIHIVIKIMENLSLLPDLEEEEIYTIFSVISSLVECHKDKLLEAMNIFHVTKRVLEVIKNIIKFYAENNDSAEKDDYYAEMKNEIQFSSKNLMIETKDLMQNEEENPIVGAAVSRTANDEISVEFLSANKKPSKGECIGYFVLPVDFVKNREMEKIPGEQITIGYFRDWLLFPNPEIFLETRSSKAMPTPVLYASISGGPAWNLVHPVQLYFKNMIETTTEIQTCVYYDPQLEDGDGGWSTEGCDFMGLKDGFYSCHCHHLSTFSIILAQSSLPLSHPKPIFSTVVYVGCAISSLILSFPVVLFVLSKMYRETSDHFVLLNVAFSFLSSVGLITFSDLLHAKCRVFALLLIYTIIVNVQWLMSYAFLFKMRFVFKKKFEEMPKAKTSIATTLILWGAPLFVVYLIWPAKYYDSDEGSCLLLITTVSKTSTIAFSFDMFISLCLYASAAYSLQKMAKDSMYDEFQEIARKFRITIAVNIFYLLSWLFAFFALQTRSRTFTTFFALSVALTSCCITFLFVFKRISFWDCYRNSKKRIMRKGTVKYTKSFESTDDEGFVEMYI